MNARDFASKLQATFRAGQVMNNPGGSTSIILSIGEDRIVYQRGRSRFYISIDTLYSTYSRFMGSNVTTAELKLFWPEIFDPRHNGHSCHWTFLFMVLKELGIVQAIRGRGVAGDPFNVMISAT